MIESEQSNLTAPVGQRCPHDGGACHHTCANVCWRSLRGYSLTTPWPGFPVGGHEPIQPDDVRLFDGRPGAL